MPARSSEHAHMCVYIRVTVFEHERRLPLLLLLLVMPQLVLVLIVFAPAREMRVMTTDSHSHDTSMHTKKPARVVCGICGMNSSSSSSNNNNNNKKGGSVIWRTKCEISGNLSTTATCRQSVDKNLQVCPWNCL